MNKKSNFVVTKEKNKLELTQFLHGCAFSPAISTFQKCINIGNFITWPGIESVKFKSLLENPLATALGHLDQERQNLQSTKEAEINEDAFPSQETLTTLHCYYAIVNIPTKGKTYTDQTGRFPCQSSRGNNYVFICYDYDANTILVRAMQKLLYKY